MGDLDAAEVVRRLGGSADWSAILRHSTSHSIRTALSNGALRRVARGTYALPDIPLAHQAAAAVRGLVSHRSAADHWLLDRLTNDPVAEVTVARNARPVPRKGVLIHFSETAPEDDHGGVTSPLRTVLDCAALLPFAEALAIADSALRRGLVTPDDVVAAAHQRRGRGRSRVIRLAEEANGLAANPFESGLRAIALETGIGTLLPQHVIRLPGLTARVDLGDPLRRLVLEADSFEYHGTRQGLVRDCLRYDELVRNGWLVLRFSWEHVMFEADWVAAVIRDTYQLRDPARTKPGRQLVLR